MDSIKLFLDFIHLSRYALVFLGCIVEGPIVMLAAGFLFRLGQFNLIPLYFSLMAGDFAADLGWYAVGRFGARSLITRLGKYVNLTPQALNKIEARFKKYQNKILFISKITMGFGFALATLIVAGSLRVDFKKYVLLNLLGGFIWTAFLMTAGYFFGNVYSQIPPYYKMGFLTLSGLLIITGLWMLNKFLSNQKI